ncbi:MAG: 4-hydroxybenzoate octaprenyltransferase [Neisseriaceae bacterium]|nr:4-hydroxybenzoate octaprenyltransferase [Neisseriaceae bacterium]
MNISKKLGIYLRLIRFDKPIGTLLLLWPAWWSLWIAANGKPDWLLVVLFGLGCFLMRSAGCAMNDFADRDFDGLVERTNNRPFAKGEITGKEAMIVCAVLCFLAALCLLPMNKLTWALSLPAVFLALSYPFTKRFFAVPQFYLGLAYSFSIPMAFASQTGSVPKMAWLLYAANTCWTLAYDTIYAIADKPDDLKLGNIKTSAITFGRFDVAWSMFFHFAFDALMAWVGIKIQANIWFWAFFGVVIGLQIHQYTQIKHRDRQKCFKMFLSNNRVGMAMFLGVFCHYLFQAA